MKINPPTDKILIGIVTFMGSISVTFLARIDAKLEALTRNDAAKEERIHALESDREKHDTRLTYIERSFLKPESPGIKEDEHKR